MGGVAGHMDHLYDNPDLTFSEMKEIMTAASNGELTAEEKVDGQNLFLSYSIPEGKAKGARNKGNLKSGGLDGAGLAQKFAGRGGLTEAFTGGFETFEKAVEALSDEEKQRVFGPDANIWYNAEVMDPGSRNVILYDDKTLKIHNVGHFVFDRETGEKEPLPEGTLQTLDNALERMKSRLHQGDFNLAREAIIQLQRLEDDSALNRAITQIDRAISEEGLGENSTVQDYVFSRLMNGIDANLPTNLKEEIVRYLLKLPGNVGLKALKKGLKKEDLEDLKAIIAGKRTLLQQAIEPIELVVHDFTVDILKGMKSLFIANTEKEVSRLKQELAEAVKNITDRGQEDPQAMSVLQRHLNKIKDFSLITTPIEAIVFDYNGHTYKFAGNFAPINQILGLFRYSKGSPKLTKESISFDSEILTEEDGKRVALLPGGFKPPHAGHYALAKYLSNEPDIDEVIVIIGKNPRLSELEPKIVVTAEQSQNLWNLYTKDDPNIKIRIQQGKTPVSDVYDLIADPSEFSEGDTVILGKSDKDVGDKRYARAQSWAERHNPGVNVEEKVMKQFGGEGMGGTHMRNLIAGGDKEEFMSKMPEHLSDKLKTVGWDIVSRSSNESLNRWIDNTLEEISTMSGGAVEGGVSSFGPPNTYNPYKQRKNSVTRPKLKRAKRRRRR